MAALTRSMFLIAAILLSGCVHDRQSNCISFARANGEIERTVESFFDALRNEDKVAFRNLTTTSFYAFDAGGRYPGTELVDLVQEAHRQGVELKWSIGHLDTKIRCDVAWSAWENIGSAGVPPDVQPVRWLESAVLVFQDGNWTVDFFHSQRAVSLPASNRSESD